MGLTDCPINGFLSCDIILPEDLTTPAVNGVVFFHCCGRNYPLESLLSVMWGCRAILSERGLVFPA